MVSFMNKRNKDIQEWITLNKENIDIDLRNRVNWAWIISYHIKNENVKEMRMIRKLVETIKYWYQLEENNENKIIWREWLEVNHIN